MVSRKILFYINVLDCGGAERVMANLTSAFSTHGYQAVLVTSSRRDGEYELAPNVKRLSMEDGENKQSFFKRNVSRILKLRSICKEEVPDIVISFTGEPNIRTILATRGLPIKTIISVRADPNIEYAGCIRGLLGKHLLPMADGCVFQTEEAKRWFPVKLQKKSKVIFNTVKEEFYQVQYGPVSERIISCGRLEKVKNFALLIDAFVEISAKHPKSQLLIYGEGNFREELQEQIEESGMEERIRLMGATNDVPKALSKASIFVLSSMTEGMPNALMEAMAVGIPCISTDCPCGGPRILIDSGVNGILVKNNDVAAMAAAMDRLLNHPLEAAALGARAKERALEFRQERGFEEWKGYVESLLSSPMN